MGSKGGGSVDTSGLEQATNRAIDLQEEIYHLTREDVQPWYQMGVGATDKLSDLLGISGGSVQSREDIYNELAPQYTTAPSVSRGNRYLSPDGRVMELPEFNNGVGIDRDEYNRIRSLFGEDVSGWDAYADGDYDRLMGQGYTMYDPAPQPVTDYDALNAAVEERLINQSDVPEDYGSLLETFDLDKFEADPSYQFRMDEANKALERSMAAQGVTLGGAGFGDINPSAARATQELNQNLASQEYGNAYNRYVQDQLNTFNMLMGAAGMGQGSTGILATGGQNYANNVGNLTTGLASAQLNADLAGQTQSNSMFSTLLGGGIGIAGLF